MSKSVTAGPGGESLKGLGMEWYSSQEDKVLSHFFPSLQLGNMDAAGGVSMHLSAEREPGRPLQEVVAAQSSVSAGPDPVSAPSQDSV